MQIVRNLSLAHNDAQIKYIPIFEKENGVYCGLFTKTDDLLGITIAGAKVEYNSAEMTLEKICNIQFGFPMCWKWSKFTVEHTISRESPSMFTVIELIDKTQAKLCLEKCPKIVEIPLGRSVYTPLNASGILKFFFATFAKKNSQVEEFVNMLKNL